MDIGYGRRSLVFFFLLLLLLALTPHNNSASASTAETDHDVADGAPIIDFLKASCAATLYPTLCFSTLSTHANKIQTNPRLLAAAAIRVALSSVVTTSRAVARLLRSRGLGSRELGATADCVELLSYSVDELRDSLREMRKLPERGGEGTGWDFEYGMKISNIQTWVGAALTDETTCAEGLAGKPVKAVVRRRIEKITRLTSIALALINRFADSHR